MRVRVCLDVSLPYLSGGPANLWLIKLSMVEVAPVKDMYHLGLDLG